MKLLQCELERKNQKTKVTFLKRGHYIVKVVEALLARLFTSGRKDLHPVARLVEERPYILRKLFKLWVGLDVICIYAKFLLNIYIPFKSGFVVIVEEYVPATLADYIYLAKAIEQSPKDLTWASKMLLRLLPLCKPTVAIYLDAGDKSLSSRWFKRRSFPERSSYVEMQRTLLLPLLNSMMQGRILIINTSEKTIEETGILIYNCLLDLQIVHKNNRHGSRMRSS
jgi:hypothetical protein